MHARVAHLALERILLDVAVAAVQLQRVVADLEADVGREALGHRAIGARVRRARVERVAARRTICRAATSSVAMSASLNCSAWKSASRCRTAGARAGSARAASSAPCAAPTEQVAMLIRPPSRPFMAMRKPSPSSPRRCLAGTRTSSKVIARVGDQPLYMLFEAIRDGRVKLDTEFLVSPKAQAMGGSRMFVEAGTSGAGRGADPRHHRAVRQRRLRRRRRGPRRQRGGLRRADDPARRATSA